MASEVAIFLTLIMIMEPIPEFNCILTNLKSPVSR